MGEVQQCVKAMVQIFTPTDPAVTSPSHLITMLKAALRQMAIGEPSIFSPVGVQLRSKH